MNAKETPKAKETAATIHGSGVVISRNYKLKKSHTGWLKAFSFADQDFLISIPAGTEVTLIQHTETTFSCFVEKTMKDFGFDFFQTQWVRFESDLLTF